jgi:hypothetical protein
MISRLLVPPLIQTDHHRHNQRHIHSRRDRHRIALPVPQQLPRIPQLAINLRHHLPVPLVRDLRLDVKKAPLHHKVLLLAIHRVDEVSHGFGAAEVELAFDSEDFCSRGGFGVVGFGDREDLFLWSEGRWLAMVLIVDEMGWVMAWGGFGSSRAVLWLGFQL